jgi:hypothetical protein
MLDSMLLVVAAGVPALTALYWICLIVGGGLLLISTIAGAHGDAGFDTDIHVDADVHVDADLPVDADVSVDTDVGGDVDMHGDISGDVHAGHEAATSLTTWFSIRFAVFFVATFGLIGVALTHLSETSSGIVAGCAFVGGFVVGQAVHQLFRKLRRSSGDSTTQPKHYLNKLARVTIATAYASKGEVALDVRGTERFVPAVARHKDAHFEIGEEVAVVGYSGGVAEVVSREEFEFLTKKD